MTSGAFHIDPSQLPEKDIWFAMGYKDAVPEPNIQEMVRSVRDRLVPRATLRYMYDIVEAERLSPRRIRMGGLDFQPEGIICSYLDGMTHALVFVATAGREFDAALKELNAERDIVSDFIADSIGSVLAECAVARIEENYDGAINISKNYSPGYCGWNIREQHILFSLFPPEPCGIRLSDSSLMTPEKSVSGFFALGERLVRQPYHCEICKNTKCYKRRNAG